MNYIRCALLSACALALTTALSASAAVITFTGGAVVMPDHTIETTNNDVTYYVADYYEEAGFRVGHTDGGIVIGNYYGLGNDVLHTHWAPHNRYGTTEIRVNRIDGAAFNLDAFGLTSNTALSGRPAVGDEEVLIHASKDGVHSSYSVLLPPDDWGGSIATILLGAQFDNIKAFWFTAVNDTDCFGIDNLVVAPGPGQVPEPGSLALAVLALAEMARRRRACIKTIQVGEHDGKL
ncbi:MAG TPA: PEP-CTERM sorting domain-containing protein [Telluria sp.]|jgi:MYXO-CTERM domain-containing protein